MRKVVRVTVLSALLASMVSGSVFASDNAPEALPELNPEGQHKVAAKRISDLFTRAHYKEIQLNDSTSEMIFDRYLRSLDANKSVFLASDIEQLRKFKDDFDEANPLSSIGALISQFAPMLPKNIQPLLQDPQTMKYVEKLVKDNPDKVNELIQKFVKSPKKNDKIPDSDIMSI